MSDNKAGKLRGRVKDMGAEPIMSGCTKLPLLSARQTAW